MCRPLSSSLGSSRGPRCWPARTKHEETQFDVGTVWRLLLVLHAAKEKTILPYLLPQSVRLMSIGRSTSTFPKLQIFSVFLVEEFRTSPSGSCSEPTNARTGSKCTSRIAKSFFLLGCMLEKVETYHITPVEPHDRVRHPEVVQEHPVKLDRPELLLEISRKNHRKLGEKQNTAPSRNQ